MAAHTLAAEAELRALLGPSFNIGADSHHRAVDIAFAACRNWVRALLVAGLMLVKVLLKAVET